MEQFATKLQSALGTILESLSKESVPAIPYEYPEDPSRGDIAFPVFSYARILKQSPQIIANRVVDELDREGLNIKKIDVIGGYINVYFDRVPILTAILSRIAEEKASYGKNNSRAGEKIVIEFSSPNTNKPLHLGHLRNNAIGESVSRILQLSGANIQKVCLFNDRGTHVCKSMVAHQDVGAGSTPESTGKRGDVYVGDLYVRFNERAKSDKSYEQRAQAMLKRWEEGDAEIRSLWKTMRDWVVAGLMATYERCGIRFHSFEYESDIYERGRDIVKEGLQRGLFFADEDGSICVDLSEQGLDTKILLRSDGTTLYVTQDLGTAIHRVDTYNCSSMIYVVANEQEYHFKVLFAVLGMLGQDWSKHCRHLSYGMVNLPEGKMKSREGTVVDADALINKLRTAVVEATQEKGGNTERNSSPEEIAIGALHYYLLWPNPETEILFDTEKSISFSGNTGPYIQYTMTRIFSLLRKAEAQSIEISENILGLTEDLEWRLSKLIGRFPQIVQQAARKENPSIVAHFMYEIAKTFTIYYHEVPILSDTSHAGERLYITKMVGQTLQNCQELLVIPIVKEM